MAWPPRFLFVSGRISVDLAHTGRVGLPAHWQRLHATEDLKDWLAASSLALEVERVRPAELRAARALRELLWQALDAVVASERIPGSAIEALNRAAAKPDLAPRLDAAGEARGWAPSATASQALATIARDAIDLLGGEARARIRQCKNPRCSIVFVDLSRPGKRAWCSMKRCGNLEKTSRYRRSHKR